MNGRDLPDIRTDANGHAQTEQTLPIGNYYVKEIAPPAGYLINTDVFPVSSDTARDEIINQDADAALTCAQQIIRANVEITKVMTSKDLNRNFSGEWHRSRKRIGQRNG